MVMDLSYSLNLLNSADAALGKMEALIDAKLKLIDKKRAANDGAAAGAGQQAGRTDEWKREAEAQTAVDLKQRDDFASLAVRVGGLSSAVARFRADVAGLLTSINARDRGRSSDAPAEYDRRLALLLACATAWSAALDRRLSRGRGVVTASPTRTRITSPRRVRGVLVVAVPGVPDESVRTPGRGGPRCRPPPDLLEGPARRASVSLMMSSVRRYLHTRRVVDDFGAPA